jgi:hypothetical protein
VAKTIEAKRSGIDRCELCGVDVGGARERARHLRSAHPDYARNVFARIVAPLLFVAALAVLSILHAPPVAYLVAMGVSYAVLFFGRIGSRKARSKAGVRPSIGIGRMLREGGVRFVMLVPVALLIVLVLQRMK